MKRIPSDTAFTIWTRASRHRVIQRHEARRVLEILLGFDLVAYFVTAGSALVVIGEPAGANYQIT